MSTWQRLLTWELERQGEVWGDVESITLSEEQLHVEFDNGFGGVNGASFTMWTKARVYFPVMYDGAEWVASVSRNPDGIPTDHIGG